MRGKAEYDSIYRGVSWHKSNRKWQARIRVHCKLHYLGHFEYEDEAARAYDMAVWCLQDFLPRKPRYNFPENFRPTDAMPANIQAIRELHEETARNGGPQKNPPHDPLFDPSVL